MKTTQTAKNATAKNEVSPKADFHKFLTSAPAPDPKEKRRILSESPLALRIRGYLWYGQLCPTEIAYWAKNYATILTRAANWMTY